MHPFTLQTLDHVALRVENLEYSAAWYGRILGLRRLQPKEWGAFPIFMVSENGTGIALFPTSKNPDTLPPGNWLKGDHYAFRIDNKEFKNAQEHLRSHSIEFKFQNHTYFHSIYFEDPDGHELEFTSPVLDVP